jgi:hypothetical protein
MQDKGKEGCWNITIGYVFIQEPCESSPRCTLQEFQFRCDYEDCIVHIGGRGLGWWGGGWRGGAERDYHKNNYLSSKYGFDPKTIDNKDM